VQAAEIEQEGVVGAELGGAGAGDVGVQEVDLHVGLVGVAPGGLYRASDGVHAGHGPAVARAVDRVVAGAAADVEQVTGRQGTRALDQAGQRLPWLAVLPGVTPRRYMIW